jgi:hypothetical protein
MKTIYTFLLGFLALTFSSCELLNKLLPDVETSFTKTFPVQIISNSGETDPKQIDVTESADYNDFKDNIDKFELNKITYVIKNFNPPADDNMYLNGTIICSNQDNTESFVVGSIPKIHLSAVSNTGQENDVTKEATENINKVLSWLDSRGKFLLKAGYNIVNSDGTPYAITGLNSGANFELVIKFYVTAKLKAK